MTDDQLSDMIENADGMRYIDGEDRIEGRDLMNLARTLATRASEAAPRGTDAQILFERKLTCEAIDGAMTLGYRNEMPADEVHWLAPYWAIGRKQCELEDEVLLASGQSGAAPMVAGDATRALSLCVHALVQSQQFSGPVTRSNVQEAIDAGQAALASQAAPKPSGYAYLYPYGSDKTIVQFNYGSKMLGLDPIAAVPYYFGEPVDVVTKLPREAPPAAPVTQDAQQAREPQIEGALRILIAACNRLWAEAEEVETADGLAQSALQQYWDAFIEARDSAIDVLFDAAKGEPT